MSKEGKGCGVQLTGFVLGLAVAILVLAGLLFWQCDPPQIVTYHAAPVEEPTWDLEFSEKVGEKRLLFENVEVLFRKHARDSGLPEYEKAESGTLRVQAYVLHEDAFSVWVATWQDGEIVKLERTMTGSGRTVERKMIERR